MDNSRQLYEFIEKYRDANVEKLILSLKGKKTDIDIPFAAVQILCRRKAALKLPCFTANPHTLFPTLLSAEQATAEPIAEFHASLIAEGSEVIDMTCGLGIDAFAIAKRAKNVEAFELNPEVAEVARHNAEALKIPNFFVKNADSIEILRNMSEKIADVIFVDPARRKKSTARAYDFSDCQPDIISNLPLIQSHCERLIVKASPMLDIHRTISQLPNSKDIFVVTLEGECKEILIISDTGYSGETTYHIVDISRSGNRDALVFKPSENEKYQIQYGSPKTGNFLFEPSAGYMKLQPWGILSHRYKNLKKLAQNSHIFFTSEKIKDFPGRRFIIEGIYSMHSPEIKAMKGDKINIFTRNYPLSPQELKKRLKVKDGGETYILATTDSSGRHLFLKLGKV